MPSVLIATGIIEGPVEVKPVGNPAKKLATFGLNDGSGPAYPVDAWEKVADSLPPVGAFVTITGRLVSRSYQRKDGGQGRSLSVTASRIEVIPLPSQPRPAPYVSPAQQQRAEASDGFGD